MLPIGSAIPRKDRDIVRGQLAADRVRAAGGTPTDAALEQVAAVIDRAAQINRLKLNVETAMCRGAAHPANRLRYGTIVDAIVRDDLALSSAISYLDADRTRLLRHIETTAPASARHWRARLLTIDEARLALRWVRRFQRNQFTEIIALLAGEGDHS